ncbi:MAG TPA: hypothetical protein PLY39_06255 [Synergistales bacterium]|nr:hypothetical protein [Synergistales bacterium]HPK42815.1 hypothetical protein [Synergistales bacterium]
MRKLSCLVFMFVVLFLAFPAAADVVDISGPWVLEFPQGQGLVVLTPTSDNPSSYTGHVEIPSADFAGGKQPFGVKMLTAPNYVTPGQDITFQPTTGGGGISFFLMNFSGPSNGIAWIVTHGGASNYQIQLSNEKALAHR